MKKQNGLILLEVLISVAIMGVVILYVARIQNKQWKHEIETLTAAKIANIYQLSTQVMFEPLIMPNSEIYDVDDISNWKVNNTIKKLQDKVLNPTFDDIIYLDIQAAPPLSSANFFNGTNFSKTSDCNSINYVRVNCSSGLDVNVVKGVMISGINQPYFSVNHVSNTNINQVRPTVITIFIDGVNNRMQLKEMNELAEAVSTQVSQIDDMKNSAYAQIHIADFNAPSESLYDTGIRADEALRDPSLYSIANNMGLAIVFELSGTQALRSDGMIAMQPSTSLCWNVSTGASDDAICQSAVRSSTETSNGLSGSGSPSKFIKTNGNLLYQTEDQETSDKVYRTPIEPMVTSFEHGDPVEIPKPVCPTIQGVGELRPHLSVVPTSFTNSGYGRFPMSGDSDYGSNEVTDATQLAKMLSGILFTWKDMGTFWEVNSNVASPTDTDPDDGLNLDSIQILALRWCERDI